MKTKIVILLIGILLVSIVSGILIYKKVSSESIRELEKESLEGIVSQVILEFGVETCDTGNLGTNWGDVGGWSEGSGGDMGWCWITQTGGSDNMTSNTIDLSSGDISYAILGFDTDHVSLEGDGDYFRVWAKSTASGWTKVHDELTGAIGWNYNLSTLITLDAGVQIRGECNSDDKNDDCRWDNINVTSIQFEAAPENCWSSVTGGIYVPEGCTYYIEGGSDTYIT